jgi:hypothetical protein
MRSFIPDAAAFEKRLAGLPLVKHPASEVVLTARLTGPVRFGVSGWQGLHAAYLLGGCN